MAKVHHYFLNLKTIDPMLELQLKSQHLLNMYLEVCSTVPMISRGQNTKLSISSHLLRAHNKNEALPPLECREVECDVCYNGEEEDSLAEHNHMQILLLARHLSTYTPTPLTHYRNGSHSSNPNHSPPFTPSRVSTVESMALSASPRWVSFDNISSWVTSELQNSSEMC